MEWQEGWVPRCHKAIPPSPAIPRCSPLVLGRLEKARRVVRLAGEPDPTPGCFCTAQEQRLVFIFLNG